jgi:hypothetical protein
LKVTRLHSTVNPHCFSFLSLALSAQKISMQFRFCVVGLQPSGATPLGRIPFSRGINFF